VHGYTPGRFLLTQMAEFPFLGNSAETISVAYSRVSSKHPEFNAEHQGVKVLAQWAHGPGIVFNTKHAIAKIDDLQGLKFRIGGGMVNEITKSLGMNVTLKPATDSYELLSSGVMDGTLLPAESTESFKIDKIIKHATTFPGGLYNTAFVFMMNQAKYDSLPADLKKVIDKHSGGGLSRTIGRYWDEATAVGQKAAKDRGNTFIKVSAEETDRWIKASAPLYDEWVADMDKRGLPGKQMLQDARDLIKKHSK